MSDQAPSSKTPLARWIEDAFGYSAVTVFILLSYVLILGRYFAFTNEVLPSGDPFTYTNQWFQTLTFMQEDPHNWFLKVGAVVVGRYGGWYRLMNLMIALFGRLLFKEPAILAMVNYALWGLATAAFYRLGRHLDLGPGRSFMVAMVPLIWPVNYGFSDHSSIPVLALDSAFNAALLIALANCFVFAINPARMCNAVLAGVSIGIAIWGRGNSLPVVGLVVCWPALLAMWNAWRIDDRRVWLNIAAAGALAVAMTFEFYWSHWTPLLTYYADHAVFVSRHTWNIKDALPYLKNIPGFMYWRLEDGIATMALSWISHVIPVATVWLVWKRQPIGAAERNPIYRQLAAAGALIYFVTFVVNLALWTDPLMNVYNALLIWRPMLIGLSLNVIVLVVVTTDRIPIADVSWILVPVGMTMLAWGVAWNYVLTPTAWRFTRPTPSTVEWFARNLEVMPPGNGKIGLLFYGSYNPAILRYYRLKNNLGADLPYYVGPNWNSLWSPTDYSDQNSKRILDEVRNEFAKAKAVIIPEYPDDYPTADPYALYKLRDAWAAWVNSAEAPRMRVVAMLYDSFKLRLLVLQREADAGGRGDPFRLPWGDRPEEPEPDYSDAVQRIR